MRTKNTIFTLFLLALLLLLTSQQILAQSVRTYTVSDGLSTNSIKSIIQDKKGYIWFASPDGLNVFNGKEFKSYGCSYRPTVKDESSALNILTLLQHKDGVKIWAGTQSSSILLFDPQSKIFEDINLEKLQSPTVPNLCYSLSYDKEGQLWIGTDAGIYIYNEEEKTFVRYTTQNSNILSDNIQLVFCDSKGSMWVGCSKGLLKYNPVSKSFTKIKNDRASFGSEEPIHISSIHEGTSGNLWIGTFNHGLALFDCNSNTLKSIKASSESTDSGKMRIRGILNNTGEDLWLCTNIGLYRYDIISNKLSQIILSTVHPNDNIYSILKDKEGGIWIGTFFQGVYYFSPRARQIECYTSMNVSKNLNGSAISSFCEDVHGRIYITSENGGLSLFDPESKRFIKPSVPIKNDNIHTLCINNSKLFVGTYSQGLKIADLTTGNIRSISKENTTGLQSNNIFSLYKGVDNIYIGTDLGCSIYDIKNGKINIIEPLIGSFVYDIIEDNHGLTWFACYYNGIFSYNKSTGEWKQYSHLENDPSSLPHDKTLSLYIDDKDALWICTEGGGICRYCYETDSFIPLTLTHDRNPINLSIVYGVLNDSEGHLWISSNNGIWVCSSTGEVLRHLTHEDGLQSNQYNFGASYRSSTGVLYFGGVNGFNVISPENIKDCGIRPTVIARITYNKDGETISSRRTYQDETIVLPRRLSSFSIDFECLSYIAPHKNEFAYKIDNQEEWTNTTETSVTILNFPYGRHSIHIKAKNGDGLWSEDVILHVNSLAPVFKSTVAKIIYILLFIAILTAAIIITEKAPIEIVLKKQNNIDKQHNLEKIEKNTRHLLSLVNQLVDDKEDNSHEGKQIATRDNEWFNQLTKIIHDNIQESEISIESISTQLNMSRSSFQRKLKALTGMSPVEFIRMTRLNKAAELLTTGNYRINEVSYMVGFNKPSYFTSLFKKQFGILPKDYIYKQ